MACVCVSSLEPNPYTIHTMSFLQPFANPNIYKNTKE
jgi:hypothetical protein